MTVGVGAAAYDPPRGPLAVLHADAALVIVAKPHGLLSVPGRDPRLADCLMARVALAYADARLVHRLDRDTSGVMVFARGRAAQRHLGLQFERRHVAKAYAARVAGHLVGRGEVDLPLRVDWPNRPRQKVDFFHGKRALTRWEAAGTGPGESRVRLRPHTGRSHQLRVHMAALGHPILGDPFYATGAARRHPRLMLHAEALSLRHPGDGRPMTFEVPAPF